MIISPPLVENFDNNHCLQACMLMSLNALTQPSSIDEIDKLTNYDKDLYTWTIVGASVLQEKLPGVKIYSNLDYEEFAARGDVYLKDYWNLGEYQHQRSKASFSFLKEQNAAKQFLSSGGKIVKTDRLLNRQDYSDLLKDNILIAWTSIEELYKGFTGAHFFLVYGESEEKYFVNDSGFGVSKKGKSGRHFDKDIFLKSAREVIVIPKGDIPIGKIISKKESCFCGEKKWFKKCHKRILEQQGLLVLE